MARCLRLIRLVVDEIQDDLARARGFLLSRRSAAGHSPRRPIPPCHGKKAAGSAEVLVNIGSSRLRLKAVAVAESTGGHDYIGHNYIGHNYKGPGPRLPKRPLTLRPTPYTAEPCAARPRLHEQRRPTANVWLDSQQPSIISKHVSTMQVYNMRLDTCLTIRPKTRLDERVNAK